LTRKTRVIKLNLRTNCPDVIPAVLDVSAPNPRVFVAGPHCGPVVGNCNWAVIFALLAYDFAPIAQNGWGGGLLQFAAENLRDGIAFGPDLGLAISSGSTVVEPHPRRPAD
jgi:hypothetical protein